MNTSNLVEKIAQEWLMRMPSGNITQIDSQSVSILRESLNSIFEDFDFVNEFIENFLDAQNLTGDVTDVNVKNSKSDINIDLSDNGEKDTFYESTNGGLDQKDFEIPDGEMELNPLSINNLFGTFKVVNEMLDSVQILDESFPALDPRTNTVRYFQKAEKFDLAKIGKHPDHYGVVFKPLTPEELAAYKEQHQNREETLKHKKYILIEFVKLMKQYLKLDFEDRRKIAVAIVNKFKLKKNKINTKIYVNGAYTNYEKTVGISGAKIIDAFEDVGAEIPLKVSKIKTKLYTKGEKISKSQNVTKDNSSDDQ